MMMRVEVWDGAWDAMNRHYRIAGVLRCQEDGCDRPGHPTVIERKGYFEGRHRQEAHFVRGWLVMCFHHLDVLHAMRHDNGTKVFGRF